ncbi:MAG: glycosyl hydrolase-related protein [Chloroflexota bacterium]|nr:glycosyl hydrolase-related protein [Chloroflexota bacterium]
MVHENNEPEVLTGIVVAHTHWDREWYLTFERFRTRLVDTLDVVLDALESGGLRYFTLDGQTIPIHDYLEIRPENEARLTRQVRAGGLLIGPWYVLPDEFLCSAESLVRNLLVGRQVARRYGEPMPIGYLPDTFGHPAQLPQLLAGFDIDSAVIYRGVRPESSEFWWQAPDGTRALTVYLPNGYCSASVIRSSPHLVGERLAAHAGDLRRMRTTANVLVMAGCDHQRPRPDLDQVLAQLDEQVQTQFGLRLRQGTLVEYVDLVRAQNPDLSVMSGEFRTGRPARITPGVISTRGYLKHENFGTYIALERLAEPLSTMGWLLGEPYPSAYLEYAWRKLLQNTPHDSITGCSIDRVHRDMLARFDAAQDVAGELAQRAMSAVARRAVRAEVAGPAEPGGPGGWLTFNTLTWPRTEVVRQLVHFLEPDTEFHMLDSDGCLVPHQVIRRDSFNVDYEVQTMSFEQSGKAYPVLAAIERARQAGIVRASEGSRWAGEEVELLFTAKLPACGYASFYVLPGSTSEQPRLDLSYGEGYAENTHLRMGVHPDGTFDVLHKATGTSLPGLGALESGGDRGDEYNYCPPEHDAQFTTRGRTGRVALVESGPLGATFEVRTSFSLPRRLDPEDRARRSADVVDMPVVTRVHLAAGSTRVEVHTSIDNVANDHRLRVSFPTAIDTHVANAQGQFVVDVRPIDLPEDEKRRAPDREEEVDVSSFPHKAFVDVSDGKFGLAVLNRGLTEYQVEPVSGVGVDVKLTLLRCVGWLSRDDLTTRWGHAGPPIETPDAQCPGTHTFEYAVMPHSGTWLEADVHRTAESYVTPILSAALRDEIGHSQQTHSFFAVQPRELVFSALKKAEADAGATILRVYNTAPYAVQGSVRFGFVPKRVVRANLAEAPSGEPFDLTAGVASVSMRAHEILTLHVES